MASADLDMLVAIMAKFPGLGPRSARRAVLHLIKKREGVLIPFISTLQAVSDTLTTCQSCGNIDTQNPCGICANERRDRTAICVVADVADLWAIERAQSWRGLYHVLGGHLSALDGVRPEDLNIDGLLRRAVELGAQEIVLALGATLEGQTTSHYLGDRLAGTNISITSLAHGIPVGGELDYLDEGTLSLALRARRPME
jgi:recombination protein RecR